jgi:deoxyribodipyrimidine photo-lyase
MASTLSHATRYHEVVPYTDIRVRHVRSGPARPDGDYVLYWMQAYRRLASNHALDEALRRADEAGKPLVVYEGLRLDYPWASVRHHRFILEGMQANRQAAARLGLAYWPFVETEPQAGRGLVARLAERAVLVVTDDFPCFVVPDQTEALARHATVPVIAVDGNTIVPLARLQGQGPAVTAAAHLRPRIHREFADAWEHRARAEPRASRVARSSLPPPFPAADLEDLDGLLARLPIDRSVHAVEAMPGGSVAARRRLEQFLARRLAGYGESRSEPAPPETGHQSGLSPYLHFGHLSIEAVVEGALSTTERWTPMNLEPRMAGRREGFYTRNPDVAAFLAEAITWRDLGYHWHWSRRKDTESFERALPAWALKTLAEHADDERDYVYTPAEWEAGATHDPLWNAAQRELVATGTIHSYLRMLWGKKVIEWSRAPEEAYRTLVHLNNKYALDGRDPNSWSGILWCFGLFDRPWAPERPVLGRIRYMSSANTARKFRLGPYLAYVDSLPKPA